MFNSNNDAASDILWTEHSTLKVLPLVARLLLPEYPVLPEAYLLRVRACFYFSSLFRVTCAHGLRSAKNLLPRC